MEAPAQAHGLRDCSLGSRARGDRVPEWLEKWVALVLQFVEREQKLLPQQLCALPPPAFYTPVAADIEARGTQTLCLSGYKAVGHFCVMSTLKTYASIPWFA